MKCHRCQQDNIIINNGHILCDICGLDIDISHSLDDDLIDLFVFNKEILNAEELGIKAMEAGKDLKDNPYSLSEINLYKRWEEGFMREKREYDLEALSFSAEKLNAEIKELKEELLEKTKENEKFRREKENLYIKLCKYQDYFKNLCSKRFIWGKSYRTYLKDISKYLH